ncbi:TPA: hypothetical protein JD893_14005 [Citrobacter freundii]|jgi:hypothetical protein|uniref:hypothetical protein n=1 Tax=Citrobacter TaxID=544 RepID=UPI0006C90C63|nr:MULTISPECIES: hypothetical protein [Citrobacter]HAT7505370.1 hypothetical protein [Citrobacter braakii]ANZ87038.1 hypothetical protein CfB38_2117 [Citrobacter freundii]KAA0552087.1 hypothetical protein F0329_18385 [Citrobacter werkmanii]KWZ91858.1 hypothetical protein HMPREF3212_01303 [Citrobacter freundii]MBD0821690.1 hypothetical protein [Citrobacter sp. C5_2]
MLEGYFGLTDPGVSKEEHQRLLAVKAALEIAKASASSASGDSSGGTMYQDLDFAASKLSELADAIQDALDLESE